MTRRDEIGDRRDVLRFGQPDNAQHKRRAKPNHDDWTDINGEKFEAGARGEAHRSKESPGGAIDRKRQRINEDAPAPGLVAQAGAIA